MGTFIDDYSRKTWIYFLKIKSEVFKRFEECRALVENQSGKRIKVLRSDNGGDYSSSQFVDFCAHAGNISLQVEWRNTLLHYPTARP